MPGMREIQVETPSPLSAKIDEDRVAPGGGADGARGG